METLIAADPQFLQIPESLFIDPEICTEVEQFLYFEAELLDDRRFAEWYRLTADDIHYWMPSRSNRLMHDQARENTTKEQHGLFDDTKRSLGWRVSQLLTNKHWCEDPPSRSRHIVTNIRVEKTHARNEYAVRSNFVVYRNRLETEVDIWVGERQDTLRRVAPRAWQIAQRTIILDQSVVLSKNLSILF